MGGELIEIPLFPLSVVLFPGMALPLHIFEPRYRKMTSECLDSQLPMGIVLALPESVHEHELPAHVGTFARIADYERLPDGRYNMLAVGTQRFEVVEVHYHTDSYISALVRSLDDDESDQSQGLDELANEARAALERYLRVVLELVGSEDQEIRIPREPTDLSYLIAMCLSCDDAEKQRILEMTSTTERLRAGLHLLEVETEALTEPPESTDTSALSSFEGDRSRLN